MTIWCQECLSTRSTKRNYLHGTASWLRRRIRTILPSHTLAIRSQTGEQRLKPRTQLSSCENQFYTNTNRLLLLHSTRRRRFYRAIGMGGWFCIHVNHRWSERCHREGSQSTFRHQITRATESFTQHEGSSSRSYHYPFPNTLATGIHRSGQYIVPQQCIVIYRNTCVGNQ